MFPMIVVYLVLNVIMTDGRKAEHRHKVDTVEECSRLADEALRVAPIEDGVDTASVSCVVMRLPSRPA